MRKSRLFTLSLGLLAAALFTAAFTLAPAPSSAGTVCSCPSYYVWQTANGSATSPSSCPSTAALTAAQNNAYAACGFEGLCSFGDSICSCYIEAGVYHSNCNQKYVCNVCIDYPD